MRPWRCQVVREGAVPLMIRERTDMTISNNVNGR
jgi:hypothetical protein